MLYRTFLLLTYLLIFTRATKCQQISWLTGNGTFINGGANIYIRLSGSLRTDGVINTDGTSVWNFTGTTGVQRITCINGVVCTNIYNTTNYPVSLGSVQQNNPNGLSIEINTLIKGTHYFYTGPTEIKEGNYWLTQLSPAPYALNDATTKFFVTTGHGLLRQSNVGTTGTFYPVGSAPSSNNYTPITITYTGTADDFGVRVFDNIYFSYNPSNGDPAGTLNNYRFVKKTWIINKNIRSSGDEFTVTPQWNLLNEDLAFTPRRPTDICIAHNYNGFWFPELNQGPAVPPAGTGPFTYTGKVFYANNLPAFYPVSVTAINTVLAGNDLVLSGTLKNQAVQLTWQVPIATAAVFYEVQRSIDAIDFKPLSRKYVRTNERDKKLYDYTDTSLPPLTKTIFYRILQAKANGEFTYSNIIAVRKDGFNTKLVVYPNPANNFVHVLFGNITGKFIIQVADMTGKVIRSYKVNAIAGNIFTIPVSNLPPGSYSLNTIDDITKTTGSFKLIIYH